MNIDIFYENWDGDIVLSGVSNFKSENEFLKQAQNYIAETRGFRIPPIIDSLRVIDIIINDDGEWHSKLSASDEGFKGKELTVYKVDLDWENPLD